MAKVEMALVDCVHPDLEKVVKKKGSAIFLHITKKFSPTKGCIALDKKDFIILLMALR